MKVYWIKENSLNDKRIIRVYWLYFSLSLIKICHNIKIKLDTVITVISIL